jgi:NAD(P)-dependent dehydrogenase (short-subunit alcohol dehydrogenase family)
MADRIALVTGAGSGIGAAVSHSLLGDGWTVVLTGRRQDRLDEAASASPAKDRAVPIACDVTDPAQVDKLYQRIEKQLGRLDLLFNNAGIGSKGATIDEIPVETWLDVVNVNLTGSFLCARRAFGLMRRQTPRGGRIINNGSISAHAPRPGSVPYTATKHAITGLTKTIALDGRPFDIACGQIDIGNALTEMAMPMTKGVPQADGQIKPWRRRWTFGGCCRPPCCTWPICRSTTNVLFMTVMATKMPFVGRG